MISSVRAEPPKRFNRNAADKMTMRETESSTKLNSFQEAVRISLNQKLLKIGHFCARPETALGTGALPLSASLDSITWKSGLLNSVDPLGNRIYNFDYICPSERTVRVTFPLIPHDFFRHIIESAPANRAGVRRWLFL